MTPETLEWVNKAENDWQTLLRESVVSVNANPDAVCFHAQQCAEKFFKARLVLAGISFRKSHDLMYLLALVLTVEPSWTYLAEGLSRLNAYAVASRYPGMDATEEQSKKAIAYCHEIRRAVRLSLDIPTND
jgi:HEPN domain-containing protein